MKKGSNEHAWADPIAGMDWVIEELLQQSDQADLVPDHHVSIESQFQQAPGQALTQFSTAFFVLQTSKTSFNNDQPRKNGTKQNSVSDIS